MGFNSTVVVMNDARLKTTDVSAGGFVNAATVIETHHADFTCLI